MTYLMLYLLSFVDRIFMEGVYGKIQEQLTGEKISVW